MTIVQDIIDNKVKDLYCHEDRKSGELVFDMRQRHSAKVILTT